MSDFPQAFQSSTRKARKPHKCCECGSEIKAKETYRYSSGVWDGRPDSFKQCIPCGELFESASAQGYPDERPVFEQLNDFIKNGEHHLYPQDLGIGAVYSFINRLGYSRDRLKEGDA